MALVVHTAGSFYDGPDALDVAPCFDPESAGRPFSPSLAIVPDVAVANGETAAAFRDRYVAEMRRSWKRSRAPWDAVLARKVVTFRCNCADAASCHRRELAAIFVKLGAEYRGEREAENAAALGGAIAQAVPVVVAGPAVLPKGPANWKTRSWLVLDCETTGLDPARDRIIEIAFCRVDGQIVARTEAWLFDPELDALPARITEITSLTIADLRGKPRFAELAGRLAQEINRADVVVAYNTPFDRAFVAAELARAGHRLADAAWVDPMVYVKEIDRYERGKKLTDAAARRGIVVDGAHRAAADAEMTARVMLAILSRMPDQMDTLIARQEELRVTQDEDAKKWRKRT